MTARPVVAIVIFPGVQPLDAVGPHEVFAGLGQFNNLETPPYDVRVVAATAGEVVTESGLSLMARPLPRPSTVDTIVVAGGSGSLAARHDRRLMQWLNTTSRTARRVASVCSGAFVLAEAGLLDGRSATTHWARAKQLADEYPNVSVDVDRIHICEGNVWTSAGVTAGIDLALALVEEDHGAERAQTIARWLVMFLRRPGGQSQFATPIWTESPELEPIRRAIELIHAEPHADLRLSTLAARVGMSSRHLSRAFANEVGETPGRYVDRVRVEAARRMLEQHGAGVDVVALRCGFGTAETMRRAFLRHIGVAPTAYRRRFTVAS